MKQKIILGTVLLIVFATIFSLIFTPKRTLVPSAVGVRYVGAEAGRVSLTNATDRRLIVQFLAVQLWRTNVWVDVGPDMVPEIIPPHETVSARVNPAPSSGPWRLKMKAAEELTGSDRLMRATHTYVRNRYDHLRGQPASFKINEFSTNVTYYGHETVLLSSVLE